MIYLIIKWRLRTPFSTIKQKVVIGFMKRIISFFKKEAVFCIAGILALITSLVVLPDEKYIDYIDFRVLSLLWCLMMVVEGYNRAGLFRSLAVKLLENAKNTRRLSFILVMLPFISSMFITNDVALITFVPFACLILSVGGKESMMIPVIALQTIAANLGSMLTPVGNPQNLYLYTYYDMTLEEFINCMAPLYVTALVLLMVFIFFRKKEKIMIDGLMSQRVDRLRVFVLNVLFVICILCVARVIPYYIMLIIVGLVILIIDRKIITKVDYMLLATFVFFFIFIGNVGRIEHIANFLENMLKNRELYISIALGQVISNVPAAILLSGFTEDKIDILRGVNIGGLGTLIASLASVISFRCYSATPLNNKSKYILVFTLYNIIFLAGMMFVANVL